MFHADFRWFWWFQGPDSIFFRITSGLPKWPIWRYKATVFDEKCASFHYFRDLSRWNSGKQRFYLHTLAKALNSGVRCAFGNVCQYFKVGVYRKQDHRRWKYHRRLWTIKGHQITGIIEYLGSSNSFGSIKSIFSF